MKFSNAISLLTALRVTVTVALLPTLREIFHNPTLLFRPHALSRIFMANVWMVYGDGVDGKFKESKQTLITPYAYGVVLDIGAGHGHSVHYLNRARVTRYIALEPNGLMHLHIRKHANSEGYHESDGSLVILPCGAEDTHEILSTLSRALLPSRGLTQVQPVDTIISILTLCTIPNPQSTILALVRDVLKPGGQLLYYERVLNPRADVAWWQRFWAPIWACAFDGCRMDRPSDVWVRELKVAGGIGGGEAEESVWREWKAWNRPGEMEESLFWHDSGRFVKR